MPSCAWCGEGGATQRCSGCHALFFCSARCSRRSWRVHKAHCQGRVAKDHVAIEMAIDVALAKMAKAPPPAAEVTCYICLEEGGDDLARGCACRGPTAGYAHLKCLAEMARRSETTDRPFSPHWIRCSLCHRAYTGRVKLELQRRAWRLFRDDDHDDDDDDSSRRNRNKKKSSESKKKAAVSLLSAVLRENGARPEIHDLLERQGATPPSFPATHPTTLMDRANKAACLVDDGRPEDALQLLEAVMAVSSKKNVAIYCYAGRIQTTALVALDRVDEALTLAKEVLDLDKRHFGAESDRALHSMLVYANALLSTKRFAEGKRVFEDMYKIQTRIFGRDHPETRQVAMILTMLNLDDDDDALETPSLETFVKRCCLATEPPPTHHPHTQTPFPPPPPNNNKNNTKTTNKKEDALMTESFCRLFREYSALKGGGKKG
mmetsp:Transcript_3430/g.11264  ORF Transcript_3430/g.11264 Transcript_3430/m.11264 type:complete len:434 (-) Transcript_3430:569-1870(-)